MSARIGPTTRDAAIRLVQVRARGLKPNKRTTRENRAELVTAMVYAYELKASIRALAEASGRSYGCVNLWLRDAGVQLRGRGGARRKTDSAEKQNNV